MCEACERMDGGERAAPTPELIACAKLIEGRMAGERAPAEAWGIVSGANGGPVAWAHFERITRSLDQAAATLSPARLSLAERYACRRAAS